MKKKYNLTIYLAYVFLFPIFIFGYLAKLYDKHILKISKNKNSKYTKSKEEDLDF